MRRFAKLLVRQWTAEQGEVGVNSWAGVVRSWVNAAWNAASPIQGPHRTRQAAVVQGH